MWEKGCTFKKNKDNSHHIGERIGNRVRGDGGGHGREKGFRLRRQRKRRRHRVMLPVSVLQRRNSSLWEEGEELNRKGEKADLKQSTVGGYALGASSFKGKKGGTVGRLQSRNVCTKIRGGCWGQSIGSRETEVTVGWPRDRRF